MSAALRIGLAGLGRVSAQIVPRIRATPGAALAAGADTHPTARERFARAHGVAVCDSVAALCRSAEIDAVWIATPNPLHCEHALLAAEAGKHVICEKPLALSLAEADRMIDAAARAGVALLQGGSKIVQPPIRAMRALVDSGRLGRVVQLTILNSNDWLQRPRLAAELDPAAGGGIVYRQGPHLVDIARYVVGDRVRSVRAVVGHWDRALGAEGNFAAFLDFADGAVASLGLSGYGYFDVSELTWGIGEGGQQRSEAELRRARPRRAAPLSEAEKYAVSPAAGIAAETPPRLPFYGLVIAHCERGAVRQSPDGLLVYDAAGCEEVVLPPAFAGAPEIVEVQDALAARRPVFPGGAWGRDTLEVCLAIRASSAARREIMLGTPATAA